LRETFLKSQFTGEGIVPMSRALPAAARTASAIDEVQFVATDRNVVRTVVRSDDRSAASGDVQAQRARCRAANAS
jgi:hypothetical protein